MNKEQLRKILKERRVALSHERRKQAAQKIVRELVPILAPFTYILSFASFKSEIDLWPLNRILCQQKKLLLSRVEEDRLALYHVHDLNTLVPSKTGILEPDPIASPRGSLEAIDVVLVPALGFDKAHHRLGYGKGHFDRLLTEFKTGCSIGVGFQEQLMPEALPKEAHDQRLAKLLLT